MATSTETPTETSTRTLAAEVFLRRVYPQLQLEALALSGEVDLCRIVVAEFNSRIKDVADGTRSNVMHMTSREYRNYLDDINCVGAPPILADKLNTTIVFLDVTIFFTMTIIPRAL